MNRYKAEMTDGTTLYCEDHHSFQTLLAFNAKDLKEFGVCSDGEARASSGSAAKYKCYWIKYDPPAIPMRHWDWQYVHEDYGGPEDGRRGAAASLEEAKQQIDDLVTWDEDANGVKDDN
tara:strand:- start:271 stop:627 length:357 start_codon:yes stop_codon:yes gene_type:complete